MIPDNKGAELGNDTTYWERVSKSRWGAYTTEIARRTVLQGHELSKAPTTALEIGCEGGRWSKLLTDLGWQMVCTDVNDESLRICKKRVPTADCILVSPDDVTVPCETDSVDLLVCVEVGPVVNSDWFLDEAMRVLRNNGLMVCVLWNRLSFRGLFAHVKDSLSGSFDWYKIIYPLWRKKLSERGFRFLHEEGFCWFPFSRASNSVFVPYFTRLEKGLGLRKLPALSPWIAFIAKKADGLRDVR